MTHSLFRRTARLAGLLTALSIVSGGLAAAGAAQAAERYVLVSHGSDSNAWWNTVKTGMNEASADFQVPVDYRNPPTGDTGDMVRLLQQAAARGYTGVITSIPNAEMIGRALDAVRAKHIPVVTINGGAGQAKQIGSILHIGQPEYEAGKAAGERAKAAGMKTFLCVNHAADLQALWDRCRGFAEAIGADDKRSTIDSGEDPQTIRSKVAAYLRIHPEVRAVLALGPDQAVAVLRGIQDAGLKGRVYVATFDVSPDVLAAIRSGEIAFAVDQQPYLQGYLPVAALRADPRVAARLAKYGLKPVYTNTSVSSGPGFIDRTNIATVQQYAGTTR